MMAFHKVPVTQVKNSFYSSFTLVLQEKPQNDTIPILLLYKKHAQYKNNAVLQRKIVIQALETGIFN